MAGRSRSRWMVWLACGIALAACVAGAWIVWFGEAPRLGADEQVFDSVDALFTAIRARDERLLADSETRLREYERSGRLGAPAIRYLEGVITLARQGKWRPAAEKLYHFMKAQRRPLSNTANRRTR